MTTAGPAVVLGIGNVLLRDEGVGVRMVDELRRLSAGDPTAVPAGTRLVDGGTLGLDLLGSLSGAGSLLLLDAVNLGDEAGTIEVLHGDEIIAAAGTEPGSVGELLAMARLMGWLPDQVALVGLQVGDTGPGLRLSPAVEAALPRATQVAAQELRSLDAGATTGHSQVPAARQQEEAT